MTSTSPNTAPPSSTAAPLWQCQLSDAKEEIGGKTLDALSVGTPFRLTCHGEIPVMWKKDPILTFPTKQDTYSMALLKVEKLEPTMAQFIVTGYKPGEFKPTFVRVTTEDVGFETNNLNWKVSSVIQAKQGQQVQPYPPYGPFALPIPFWIWIVLASIGAVIVVSILWWRRKAKLRRRLKEELAEHSTGLSAVAQFHKTLRQLQRSVERPPTKEWRAEWLRSLELALRVYVMCEYQFLTLKESSHKVIQNIKHINRDLYREISPSLEKLFSEMERFEKHLKSHETKDFMQLLSMAKVVSDQTEKFKVKRR